MKDIEIQVWTASDKKTRWRELLDGWYEFWLYEPLNSALIGVLEGDHKESIASVFEDMMFIDDTPCVVAWDTLKQRVAGFVFPVANYPQGQPELLNFEKFSFEPATLKKLQELGSFLDELFVKADLFNRYSVDKVFVIQVTAVLQEYTRQGLAHAMTEKVLQVARDEGFTLAASESTSAFTQRNKIKRFNFETVLELDYENNYSNYAEMPASIKESHKTAAVLVKRL